MGPRRWALLLPLALGACSKIAPLDGSKTVPLAPSEQTDVRAKVAEAVQAKKWKPAWNQEVAAGGDRGALERIAVAALADDDGDAKDMLEAIRERWGGLSPEARALVAASIRDAEAKRDWERAAEIAIATADDPPKFAEAWAIYRRTPPNKSEDVLKTIHEAREEATGEPAGVGGAPR